MQWKGNKMSYKFAIFDMDGTILDTLEDLADSTNYALKCHGFPERSIDEVRKFVGNGIGKLIERAVPENTSREKTAQVLDTFMPYYGEHSAIKTKPYDGIIETIQKLKENGVRTAVVSNKADFAVQTLCEDYFPGVFDYALGEKQGLKRKPAPDMVEEALRQLGAEKKDSVYIGDSEVDFATAKNSGLDVIMVGWGFREKEFILSQGAEFVVDEKSELLDRILG